MEQRYSLLLLQLAGLAALKRLVARGVHWTFEPSPCLVVSALRQDGRGATPAGAGAVAAAELYSLTKPPACCLPYCWLMRWCQPGQGPCFVVSAAAAGALEVKQLWHPPIAAADYADAAAAAAAAAVHC
jgi:hypothetical protein